VPSFPSRQESARKSRAPPPQTPPADFRTPLLARPAKQISCLLHEKPAILPGSTLPPPPGSVQSCESLLRSSGDSVDYGVSDHHRRHMSTAPGRIMGKPFGKALRRGLSGRVADHPRAISAVGILFPGPDMQGMEHRPVPTLDPMELCRTKIRGREQKQQTWKRPLTAGIGLWCAGEYRRRGKS